MGSHFSLSGKTFLVTGSTTGLGRAMACALGAAGAKVAMNFRNDLERAEAAFSDFQNQGYEGGLFRGSVIDAGDISRLRQEIESQLGPVDGFIVNATPAQPLKPIEEYDWEFYQSMIDFFIKSPYLLTREFLPHMREQKWGRIINIASEVFTRGVAPFSAYVAAKGGQLGWTRSMANELAADGVTVNAISPGWIPVERHADDPEEDKQAYLDLIPMQRWGVPSDMAGATVFLASDSSSFVTGQNIHVNGGTVLP
ncbi:MAG: 3-oxoacyl-ACP reductase [Planctomycetia bacterium TMED53]|nr:MAG: 3-oxoacyl-ACP reductase [Planctomycetia bacterium TMED53]